MPRTYKIILKIFIIFVLANRNIFFIYYIIKDDEKGLGVRNFKMFNEDLLLNLQHRALEGRLRVVLKNPQYINLLDRNF